MKGELKIALALTALHISTPAPADDAGRVVFDKWCSHCHAPGAGHPGTQRLGWDRGEENAVLEQRKDLAPEYVKYVVRNGFLEMPTFRVTEISNTELDALANYLAREKD